MILIKVLIVDDEPKLRQGLQTLIPWKKLGFEVIAVAANGEEALSIIAEKQPDIALVDIRMPLMDGLQLLQAVSSEGYRLHVIILSGYADFEYAKQAIKYGVDGYLLKPVDIQEMTYTLERIREQIEQEQRQKEQEQITKADQTWLLHRLLVPQHTEDSIVLRNIAEDAGMFWESYEVVIVRPQNANVNLSDKLHTFLNKLKPCLEYDGKGVVTVFSSYIVIFLNQPLRGTKSRQKYYQWLKQTLGSSEFIAATGGAVSTPEKIHMSFAEAESALKQAFFHEKEESVRVNSANCLVQNAMDTRENIPDEMMGEFTLRLYYSLDTGNHKMIRPLLEQALSFFLAQKYDETHIKESFFYLCHAVVHKLNIHSYTHWKETEKISHFLKGIFAYEYLTDLLAEIDSFLMMLAKDTAPEGKEKELKMMISIIHNHYSDPLKLETLAGTLNYSTAHLGQIFKNKTGEYFNTYLDKIRIQKAKELLNQGMRVYEVSEKVGYTSVNYFYSKFKKYEGCSPSDFKIHNL